LPAAQLCGLCVLAALGSNYAAAEQTVSKMFNGNTILNMNEQEIIKAHYQRIASKGGKVIAARGPDYMRKLQKLGVAARKRNAKKRNATK
jgi:hypothetical protein